MALTMSADSNKTEFGLNYDHPSISEKNETDLAQQCMLDYYNAKQLPGIHCPAVWDGYTCWPATTANTTIYRPCPAVFALNTSGTEVGQDEARQFLVPLTDDWNTVPHFLDEPLAYRICNGLGHWKGNWSNYKICLEEIYIPRDRYPDYSENDISVETAMVMRDIYFVGGCISLVLLILTLFIFCYFRSLQCSRISIHKNLVVSFIIRFVLDVVTYEPYVFGRTENTYNDVEWLCKLLKAFVQCALLANFFWMFVEGLFLHNRIVVSVFSNDAPFKIFHFIGWGMPVLVTIAWALCLIYFHERHCWHYFSDQPYMFIIYGPVVVSLFVNVCFLISIIRVLIIKLRAHNTVETAQIRKAIRATVVLFPLLGITNLFFVIEPQENNAWRDAYHITNAILHSSQGIFVSVLYCFMNGEWILFWTMAVGNRSFVNFFIQFLFFSTIECLAPFCRVAVSRCSNSRIQWLKYDPRSRKNITDFK